MRSLPSPNVIEMICDDLMRLAPRVAIAYAARHPDTTRKPDFGHGPGSRGAVGRPVEAAEAATTRLRAQMSVAADSSASALKCLRSAEVAINRATEGLDDEHPLTIDSHAQPSVTMLGVADAQVVRLEELLRSARAKAAKMRAEERRREALHERSPSHPHKALR